VIFGRSGGDNRRTPVRIYPFALLRAFLNRDWRIALSYRLPFAFDLFQSLTSLVFLFFLGRLVGPRGHSVSTQLNQGYFAFAVLGTALLGIVTTSLGAVADRIRTDQTTGTLEALLTMPTPSWLTVLASATYQLVYATTLALITVVIAVAGFGMRFDAQPAGVPIAILGLTGAVALFSSVGVAFAAFVIVFKRGQGLIGLTTSVFSLLGGVYYPIAVLPGPLQVLAHILPFTWAVDVIRQSLLAGELPWAKLGLLLGTAAVLVPASLWLLTAAARQSRRTGTLGQY
jgi:ABC-2 type transport system permease protein